MTGPDGALWFTVYEGNIGRITTAGVVTEYPVGIPGSRRRASPPVPTATSGSPTRRNVKIGRMTTTGHAVEFPIPSGNANLIGITLGPDGNLWFAEDDANNVARITPERRRHRIPGPHRGRRPGLPDPRARRQSLVHGSVRQQDRTGEPEHLAPQPATVDANAVAGSSSDHNGVLEPGETVEVSPAWQNTLAGPQSFTGTASSLTGPAGATYTIDDATANYGSVAGGATADCHDATGDCYLISVSNPATRPVQHWDVLLTEDMSVDQTKYPRLLHVGDSFADVPRSNQFYRVIEDLFHKGVTAGCDAFGNYCPDGHVTRQQMAVFLLKGKHGSSYVPPPCVGGVFTDVPCTPGVGFSDWIEQLAAEGITAGCGGGQYCPTVDVTRAQMAVFLLKSEHGGAYTPPACAGVFGDVPCPSQFADWIEQLAAEGVTAGCGGGNFCPDDPNIRGQMAAFLVRVFGLNLYGP